MSEMWNRVEQGLLDGAKGIAFDGCHKIYVLMDDEQMAEMKECGYDPLIPAEGHTTDELLSMLMEWYENSCGLRFISAVHTNHADPNAGFIDLIGQGVEPEVVE
jgi:hypothetical protein